MAYAKKLTDEEIEHLVEFAESLGLEAGDFDGEVDDFKSAERAEINNGGLEAQLAYLCDGMGPAEAEEYIRKVREENG